MNQPYEYFKDVHSDLKDLEEHLDDTMDVIYDACGDVDDAVIRAVRAQIKRCTKAVQELRYEFKIYTDLLLFMQGFVDGEDTDEGTTEGHEIEHQGDA